MLTHEDKELLAKKGISEQQIEEQLACFEHGFPFLRLAAAASVENNGIMVADEAMQKKYLAAWDAYKDGDRKIVKFVPASGAASRMFKNMFEFLGADYDVPTTDFEKKFFDHIHNFAFYNDLILQNNLTNFLLCGFNIPHPVCCICIKLFAKGIDVLASIADRLSKGDKDTILKSFKISSHSLCTFFFC